MHALKKAPPSDSYHFGRGWMDKVAAQRAGDKVGMLFVSVTEFQQSTLSTLEKAMELLKARGGE
jgi:hypothetical protein